MDAEHKPGPRLAAAGGKPVRQPTAFESKEQARLRHTRSHVEKAHQLLTRRLNPADKPPRYLTICMAFPLTPEGGIRLAQEAAISNFDPSVAHAVIRALAKLPHPPREMQAADIGI